MWSFLAFLVALSCFSAPVAANSNGGAPGDVFPDGCPVRVFGNCFGGHS
jgi:hypothetical protein